MIMDPRRIPPTIPPTIPPIAPAPRDLEPEGVDVNVEVILILAYQIPVDSGSIQYYKQDSAKLH
jgi:hypothetical protein